MYCKEVLTVFRICYHHITSHWNKKKLNYHSIWLVRDIIIPRETSLNFILGLFVTNLISIHLIYPKDQYYESMKPFTHYYKVGLDIIIHWLGAGHNFNSRTHNTPLSETIMKRFWFFILKNDTLKKGNFMQKWLS